MNKNVFVQNEYMYAEKEEKRQKRTMYVEIAVKTYRKFGQY